MKNEKQEIAKEAYRQIVKAITDLEEQHGIYCGLPEFVDVDGQRFFKGDLHLHSFPVPDEIVKSEEQWFGMKAEVKEDGLCYFEDGTVIDPNQPKG